MCLRKLLEHTAFTPKSLVNQVSRLCWSPRKLHLSIRSCPERRKEVETQCPLVCLSYAKGISYDIPSLLLLDWVHPEAGSHGRPFPASAVTSSSCQHPQTLVLWLRFSLLQPPEEIPAGCHPPPTALFRRPSLPLFTWSSSLRTLIT